MRHDLDSIVVSEYIPDIYPKSYAIRSPIEKK